MMPVMKTFSLILFLFAQLQISSWAQTGSSLACEITERFNEEILEQAVEVPVQDADPHGSLEFIQLKKDPQQLVMVAYLKGQAIISVSDQTTGAASSSTAPVKNSTDLAHHQVVFAGAPGENYSVVIDCHLQAL